jgi:precorrin-3B synthase
MPTGDGLLVRLQPNGTVPLAAFATLCTAARRHGNGVIEVTSRGNIQIRGLSAESAPRFAAAVAALGIAADDGVPVHCNVLAGIGADELFDAGALAAELRHAPAQRALAAKLSPKVAVAIDGGGGPNLATLSADVRLCAQPVNGEIILHVAIGGDGQSATDLGNIDPVHGAGSVVRLLDVVARHGRKRRARDIVAADGEAVFRTALADLLLPGPNTPLRGNERDVIGNHPLRDGSVACGVGLAFGHSDATTLEQLTEVANAAGASGFRAAAGRAVLAIGLPPLNLSTFTTAAEKLGFITRAGDPRRRVIACAGAPICGSAYIAARAMAPLIADRAEVTVHVSGCAKGCAHPAPAALTVVGTPAGCALVADGTARDAPFSVVAAKDLTAAMTRFAQARTYEDSHV